MHVSTPSAHRESADLERITLRVHVCLLQPPTMVPPSETPLNSRHIQVNGVGRQPAINHDHREENMARACTEIFGLPQKS